MATGLDVALSHYLSLSFVLALGLVPMVLLAKSKGARLALVAGLLYATLPVIAVWGFWVIPMSLAILFSIYSLFTFERRPALSMLFSALAVMTHPVVGALLVGFYVVNQVFNRGRPFKRLTAYNAMLIVFLLTYWHVTGFTQQYVQPYLNQAYCNLMNTFQALVAEKRPPKPATPSVITPPSKPKPPATATPKPPPKPKPIVIAEVVKPEPPVYPDYLLAPRWVWSSLLLLVPPALVALLRAKRVRVDGFTWALGVYGAFLLVMVPTSLYLGLVWKAERYLASPASIYAIAFIALALSYLRTRSLKWRFLAGLVIAALACSSLLDPRVAFYVNPYEGDRVTFKLSERRSASYVFKHLNSKVLVSDYNLMTSYLRYLAFTNNCTGIRITKPGWLMGNIAGRSNWVFIFRLYSVESYYLWKLNYKRDPSIINKAFRFSNTVYSSGEVYVFRSWR